MGRALCAAVLLLCAVLAPVSAPAKRAAPFVLLRVEGPPLAHVAAGMSPDEQRRTVARMREAQRPLLAALDSLKVPVVWTYQRVLNGVQVRADVDRAVLRALPGVVQVHPVLLLREVLDYSVPHIGAEQAQLELDVQGTGVAIGIIDAGIDYIHQAFAGPGTKEAYAANDPTTALDYFDGLLLFPTVKVAGGYDFVGDDFDPGEGDLPQPDEDPMPAPEKTEPEIAYGEHGTHVAAIAAGFDTAELAPGVAPGAQLYSLKVLARTSTNMTSAAIEWAADPNGDGEVSDRLDVLNMSLGSAYGGSRDDEHTAEALAIRSFVELGGVVVASAGNSGNLPLVTSAPSSFAEAVGVASSVGPRERKVGVEVAAPDAVAGLYDVWPAHPKLAPPPWDTGPVEAPLCHVGPGCEQPDYPYEAKGSLVLADRGTCSFAQKLQRAEAAGAKGLLVVNDEPGAPITMQGEPKAKIPGGMMWNLDGKRLIDSLAGGAKPVGRYAADYPNLAVIDTIAGSSSRGPASPLFPADPTQQTPSRRVLPKPDITAPGANIVAAQAGTGTKGTSKGGTSMAAPHVAGVVALLREVHPDFTPREIRAALMNTAVHDVYEGGNPLYGGVGPRTPIGRQGAGRVDVIGALTTEVLAFGESPTGEEVTLDLGLAVVARPETLTGRIRIVNKGDEPTHYSVRFKQRSFLHTNAGVEVSLDHAEVTIPPGGHATLNVTAKLDPAGLNDWLTANRTPDAANTADGNALEMVEYDGFVLLEPAGGGPVLRVPVYLLVRPAAEVAAPAGCVAPGGAPVRLVNSSPVPGVVEVFTLVAEDPDEPEGAETADVRYVGVRTEPDPGGDLVQFAIVTGDFRAHPIRTYIAVMIDSDHDTIAEYALSNYEEGWLKGSEPWGRVVALLLDPLGEGLPSVVGEASVVHKSYVLSDLFTSAMVLSVPVGLLGLCPEDPSFDFWVATFDAADELYGTHSAVDLVPDGIQPFQLRVSKHSHRFDPTCGEWRLKKSTFVVYGEEEQPVTRVPECFPTREDGSPDPPGLLLLTNNAPGLTEAIALPPGAAPVAEGCREAITVHTSGGACVADVTAADVLLAPECVGDIGFDGPLPAALAPGTHVLSYGVWDAWGTPASCKTVVTVEDVSPPYLGCGAPVVPAPAPGAALELPYVASDPCGVEVSLGQVECGGCQASLDGSVLRLAGVPARLPRVTWTIAASDPTGNRRTETCASELAWPVPPEDDEGCGAGGRGAGSAGWDFVLLLALLVMLRRARRPGFDARPPAHQSGAATGRRPSSGAARSRPGSSGSPRAP